MTSGISNVTVTFTYFFFNISHVDGTTATCAWMGVYAINWCWFLTQVGILSETYF